VRRAVCPLRKLLGKRDRFRQEEGEGQKKNGLFTNLRVGFKSAQGKRIAADKVQKDRQRVGGDGRRYLGRVNVLPEDNLPSDLEADKRRMVSVGFFWRHGTKIL